MKLAFATVAVVTAVVSFKVGTATGTGAPFWKAPAPSSRRATPVVPVSNRRTARRVSVEAANDVIENYCKDCHNDQLMLGNQSFDNFDVGKAEQHRLQAEKMIRKLRTEMMPLPGAPRPGGDTLAMVAQAIEDVVDRNTKPNP